MVRWTQLLTLAVLVAGCGPRESMEAPREDELHALFMREVLSRSLTWLGDLPGPSDYCVAVAPGEFEPDLAQGHGPGREVLARLNASSDSIRFHSYRDCSPVYPFTAPGGNRAGVLWVTPIDPGLHEISGGWLGFRQATVWGCAFRQVDGAIELDACRLRAET